MSDNALEKRKEEVASLRPRVLAQCKKMVWREADSHQLAEDLTQDTIIKALRNIQKYKGDASLSSWVYRIAYNVVIDHFRRRYRNPLRNINIIHLDSQEEPQYSSISNNLIDWASSADPFEDLLRNDLRKAIALLPERSRQIVELRMEGYAFHEIAELLGINCNTVKTQYFRVKRKLKINLKAA